MLQPQVHLLLRALNRAGASSLDFSTRRRIPQTELVSDVLLLSDLRPLRERVSAARKDTCSESSARQQAARGCLSCKYFEGDRRTLPREKPGAADSSEPATPHQRQSVQPQDAAPFVRANQVRSWPGASAVA
jgi:hypothetical protein